MLDYSPLWETLKRQGKRQYALIEGGIDKRTMDQPQHNRNIIALTLERICRILNCTPNDVLVCVATLQDFDRQFGAYSEANIAAMELWTETSDDLYTLPTQVELTYEESQEYSDIWSDLSTYANTEIFKFVMGEYNFDSDWDNFISTLKEMGVEEAVEIYQVAYDRYIEAYGL